MIELANCENVLLEEIGRSEFRRKDVAKTYALAIRSSENVRVDWKKVNEAIIARWSLSALEWIKERAWSGRSFVESKP
jgi:hypothetical protein